jgi:hydroxyacylglutathione hydrolase
VKNQKMLMLSISAGLCLSATAFACGGSGSCDVNAGMTGRAVATLNTANEGRLGSTEAVRCGLISGTSPIVKVTRCADVAPGKPEDQCLSQHKFSATYGKPRSNGGQCVGGAEGQLPLFEVVELNPGYYVIRQNKCSNLEAPFMYLMVGETGAFLHDTGAGDESGVGDMGVELRRLVEEVLARKSAQVGRPINLTVGHGHSHGDHMGGDGAFESSDPNKPAMTSSGGTITVVGGSPAQVASAYNIPAWNSGTPLTDTSVGSLDLGGRRLSVIPIPGHQSASVAFYDHATGDVLTGDSLYPGNVFTNGNWNQHKASTARLKNFLDNLPAGSPPPRMMLGSHVEHSHATDAGPGVDLGWGNPNQPNEHNIVLRKSHLDEMHAYMQSGVAPQSHTFGSFSIQP